MGEKGKKKVQVEGSIGRSHEVIKYVLYCIVIDPYYGVPSRAQSMGSLGSYGPTS